MLIDTGLSTSSILRIGYHAACLILAVRSLEEVGQGLRPRTFLPEADGDNVSDIESHTRTQPERTKDDDGNALRANACKYAMLVLQTFLEMPHFLMDGIETCLCLCIGYCALLLAHYDESQSKIPDQVSRDLIIRIDQWIRSSPGKAWSFKYGALAKHKIESRINGDSSSAGSQQPSTRVQLQEQENPQEGTDTTTGIGYRGSHKPARDTREYHADEEFAPEAQRLEPETDLRPSIYQDTRYSLGWKTSSAVVSWISWGSIHVTLFST